jgi:putative zinc finger/helix-turn-helix YgiT family protein
MKSSKEKTSNCPECGSGQLLKKTGIYETDLFDGDDPKPLQVANMNWLECDNCKEVILDDLAMEKIERARYKELGLLAPQEIQGIRSSLGKTQRQMAILLAVGEKTYSRWENGNFYQTRHNDRILRFISRIRLECPDALRILEDISGMPEHPKHHTVGHQSEHVPENWFGPSLCDHTGHVFGKTRRMVCTRNYQSVGELVT